MKVDRRGDGDALSAKSRDDGEDDDVDAIDDGVRARAERESAMCGDARGDWSRSNGDARGWRG